MDNFLHMTKQRIYEILLTAVISAGIAFLQSLLSQYAHDPTIANNALTAFFMGASIHGARSFAFA